MFATAGIIHAHRCLRQLHRSSFASARARSPKSIADAESPPPLLLPPRAPGDNRLLIVLDMDETLIHSNRDWNTDTLCRKNLWKPSFQAELPSDSEYKSIVHVYKRPGLDAFVAELSRGIAASEYEVVVFTAAMQHYADIVLDTIDLLHFNCPHHAAMAAKQNGGSTGVESRVTTSPFQLEAARFSAEITSKYGNDTTCPRRPKPPAITESVFHHRLYRESTITHEVNLSQKDLLELGRLDAGPKLESYKQVKELGRLGRDLGSYSHFRA
jgi:hypothetical protein